VEASGTMAGRQARPDVGCDAWKAPAGIEATLRNDPDLVYRLMDPENDQLNPLDRYCLHNFHVYGDVSWGRTLVGADVEGWNELA